MTDWRFWKALGRLYSSEMHAGQCHATIFPDFSPVTAAKRKSLVPVLRSMTELGLQPFLAYPAVIKLRHGGWTEIQFTSILFGKRRILSAPCHRVGHLLQIHRAAGGRRLPFLRPDGRGLVASMEEMLAGGIWMIVRSLFFLFFFFPLSSWDSIFIYSIQLSLCW